MDNGGGGGGGYWMGKQGMGLPQCEPLDALNVTVSVALSHPSG